jgi:hypothetical protein
MFVREGFHHLGEAWRLNIRQVDTRGFPPLARDLLLSPLDYITGGDWDSAESFSGFRPASRRDLWTRVKLTLEQERAERRH